METNSEGVLFLCASEVIISSFLFTADSQMFHLTFNCVVQLIEDDGDYYLDLDFFLPCFVVDSESTATMPYNMLSTTILTFHLVNCPWAPWKAIQIKHITIILFQNLNPFTDLNCHEPQLHYICLFQAFYTMCVCVIDLDCVTVHASLCAQLYMQVCIWMQVRALDWTGLCVCVCV